MAFVGGYVGRSKVRRRSVCCRVGGDGEVDRRKMLGLAVGSIVGLTVGGG